MALTTVKIDAGAPQPAPEGVVKAEAPAAAGGKSGTRKEELLVDQGTLSKMWVLRRILMQMGTVDAMQFLLDKMKDAKSNEDFFASMNQ